MTPRRKQQRSTTPSAEHGVRIGIYTRKSVTEGLDQSFNTLDAQRECVEAYVRSQAGVGWTALETRYDDGGFSGANTDRPAFQRLMDDVRAGSVDAVAVYRLDRLSRSLLDFAQLIRLLYKHGVAFVSVTERFDTSSAMGRMVLNLLATFAQFERETIAQRTADKIGASRRRGMWTGGRPVLGFDVIDKKLVVNEAEAEQVRSIFELYLDLGGALGVAEELRLRGIPNKRWTTVAGKAAGGTPFNKGTVIDLLRNPLYAGKVRAGDDVCDGEHESVVTDLVWAAVQEKLRNQAPARRSRPGRRSSALLAGIARCVCGAALTPSSTRKGTTTYQYYICSRAQKRGVAACPGSRIAAGKLESFVVAEIRKIGRDPQVIEAAVIAASADRKEEGLRLRAHVTEVRTGRSKLVGERARLITAVGDGNAGDGIMTRIRELDESVQAADIRLRDVEGDLATLTQGDTDPVALTRALAEFDGVWDELALAERARLLDLLLEAVVFDGPSGDVELRFRPMPAHVTDEVAA